MAEILETPPTLLRWTTEGDTAAAAARLALRPELADALITLDGALAAGKTTFTRHLLRALGVTGRIKSPSYAVLESYELPDLTIHHFDFYRFSDPREWEDAGFRELLAGPGLKLCEWPSHARALLAHADLQLQLHTETDDSRRVEARALSACGRALLESLAR